MAIKFSQFNLRTDHTDGMYLVGYDGNQNIHITVDNLFDDFINGTANQLAMFGSGGDTVVDSIASQNSGATQLDINGQLYVDSNTSLNEDLTVTGGSTFNGNVVLGNASTDLITQTGTLYLNGPVKDTTDTLGAADQVLLSDATGELTFTDVYDLNIGSAETVSVPVKNVQGSALVKGDPVYISGSVGASGRLEVQLADASNALKMPAVGLLKQDLANNGEGFAVVTGKLTNLITDPIDGVNPTENDIIYVKPSGTSGSALTTTKPVYGNFIQNIGKVGRVSTSSDGNLVVSSILRTNDIPNLTPGRLWIGSTGNTIESQTLFVDEANEKLGVGTATPLHALDVECSDTDQVIAGFKTENTLKGGITIENSRNSNNKAHLFIRTSGDGKGRICLGHSNDYQSFDNLKIEKKPNNTYTDANMAFGGDGVADHNKFRLRWRHDVADATDAYNGYSSNGIVTGSTALTEDRTVAGVNAYFESTASGGDQTNELRLKGVNAYVDNQGAGDANHIYGVFASAKNSKTSSGNNQTDITGGFLRAYNTSATGVVDNMYGVNGIALIEGTGGSVNNAHGVNGRVTIDSAANSPITEKAAGGYFVTQLESSNNNLVAEVNGLFAKNTVASDIADVKGLEVVNDVDAGTIGNAYLIKGDVQLAGGASITNNFGIYLNGVSKNFLDGQVGVNRVPSAQLDVKNQTANTNAFRVLSSNNVASLILKEDSSSNAELTLRDGLGNTNVKLDTAGKCFIIGSTELGIGTDAPFSKLSVAGGDIEVETIASGLILKSPNGTRYRITVDNSGNLSTSAV